MIKVQGKGTFFSSFSSSQSLTVHDPISYTLIMAVLAQCYTQKWTHIQY